MSTCLDNLHPWKILRKHKSIQTYSGPAGLDIKDSEQRARQIHLQDGGDAATGAQTFCNVDPKD